MKKNLLVSILVVLILPGLTFADLISFKIGYFIPRAQSDLWETEFENLDLTRTNFQASNFAFTYEYFLSRHLSLALSIDGYSKAKVGAYRDFVGYSDEDGDWAYPDEFTGEFQPSHTFNVSITPVQVSLLLAPMGRGTKMIPYIGGGVGLYLWNIRLQGDLIDFSDPWYDTLNDAVIYPIYFTDAREENKISFGYHVLGGITFPIAKQVSIGGEFKYNVAKGNLTEAFEGFEPFDLTGYTISLGLNYWF